MSTGDTNDTTDDITSSPQHEKPQELSQSSPPTRIVRTTSSTAVIKTEDGGSYKLASSSDNRMDHRASTDTGAVLLRDMQYAAVNKLVSYLVNDDNDEDDNESIYQTLAETHMFGDLPSPYLRLDSLPPASTTAVQYVTILDAPTSMTQRVDRDPLTFVNKGQPYDILLVCPQWHVKNDAEQDKDVIVSHLNTPRRFRSSIARQYSDSLISINSPQPTANATEMVVDNFRNSLKLFDSQNDGTSSPHEEKRPDVVKSIVYLLFHDEMEYRKARDCWSFWRHNHRDEKRALEVVTDMCDDIFDVVELSFHATMFSWRPKNGARLCVRVNCLSTEFSSQKGVKGLPLRLQLDTFGSVEDPIDSALPVSRGFCQIKVFRDKGAERKAKEEEKSFQKQLQRVQRQSGVGSDAAFTGPDDLPFHRREDVSHFQLLAVEAPRPHIFDDASVSFNTLNTTASSSSTAPVPTLDHTTLPADQVKHTPAPSVLKVQTALPHQLVLKKSDSIDQFVANDAVMSTPPVDTIASDLQATLNVKTSTGSTATATTPTHEMTHHSSSTNGPKKRPCSTLDEPVGDEMEKMSLSRRDAKSARTPVLTIYARYRTDQTYRAVYLSELTQQGIIAKLCEKFGVHSLPKRICKKTPRGLLVEVDDEFVEHIEHEEDFIVSFSDYILLESGDSKE